jgi:glycosyltransferase involved in cell wall biosynthesis
MDSLTVVIPTFNRDAVLKRALDGYVAQSTPKAIHELIVVDDGSTDDTEGIVTEMARLAPFSIRYLRQANRGPAAARNLGITETSTEVVLFTDSDIVPGAELVAQHLEWHNMYQQANVGILGYVTWPSQPTPTPFMKWYGERQLFDYWTIRHAKRVGFGAFYSCNLSLKTQFLVENGQFNENFKTAAFEDIELGYRLGEAGLKLLHNPLAIAFHHQFFSFVEACRKSNANSAARRVFFQTEVGRQVLEQQRQRRSRLSYRIARWAATAMATILEPVKRFLDSDVRFPSSVYRLLYWRDTTNPLDLDDLVES